MIQFKFAYAFISSLLSLQALAQVNEVEFQHKDQVFKIKETRVFDGSKLELTREYSQSGKKFASDKTFLENGEIKKIFARLNPENKTTTVEVRSDGKVVFTEDEDGEKVTKSNTPSNPLVTISTLPSFIWRKREELLANQPVYMSYPVMKALKTVEFKIQLESQSEDELVFKVRSTSFVVRNFFGVNTIRIRMNRQNGSLISYQGRVERPILVNGSRKNIDSTIQWKPTLKVIQ